MTPMPPLNRHYLDRARTPLRVLLGLAFIAYSSAATVLWVDHVTAPLLDTHAWVGMDAGLLLGFALTVVLSLWEWVTSEEFFWYLIGFVPDVALTFWFTWPWLTVLVPHTGLAVLIAVLISGCTAYYGEILLFGKRRPARTAASPQRYGGADE